VETGRFILTERKQVIAREKYHHEEHEGHEVKQEPIGSRWEAGPLD